MRISDTERQRAVEELRRHSRAGRIDLEEFGRRVEAVLAAETLADLDLALADLPRMSVAHPAERAGERPGRSAWRSRLVLLIVVLVGAAAVAAVVAAQVVWAAVIVVAWAAGMLQARLRHRA